MAGTGLRASTTAGWQLEAVPREGLIMKMATTTRRGSRPTEMTTRARDDNDQLRDGAADGAMQGRKRLPTSDLSSGDRECVADAINVFRSLDFLFRGGGGGGDAGKGGARDGGREADARGVGRVEEEGRPVAAGMDGVPSLRGRRKLTQPLFMCLVTKAGRVHFFYALPFLLSGGGKHGKSAASLQRAYQIASPRSCSGRSCED